MEKIDFDLKITDWETGEVFNVGICRDADNMDNVYDELAYEMALVLAGEKQ